MILGDVDISRLVVQGNREIEEHRQLWKAGDFDGIGEKILIDPFDPSRIGTVSYDLSVGQEWVSLRDPYLLHSLEEGHVITIAPHESILVLSEEYLALPRTVAGFVVPRARKLFEGSTIAATRIDPTWYGKLVIGFTNLSQYPTSLAHGERFCTLMLLQTSPVARALSSSGVPHLGRMSIGKLEYPSLRPNELKTPDQVCKADVEGMVKDFGAPFDIVRGALKETKDEVIRVVEKDFGPRMVDTAVNQASRRAFRTLEVMFGILLGVLGILVTGLLDFLFRHH